MIFNIDTASRQELDAHVAQLRADQSTWVGRSEAIINAATGRELTADERRRIAGNSDRVEAAEAEILTCEAARRVAHSTDPLDQPRPRITPADSGEPLDRPRALVGQARGAPRVIDLAAAPARASYSTLFGAAGRRGSGGDFARFLDALVSGDSQYLRNLRNAGSTAIGVDGGFAVPTPVSAALLDAAVEQSQFLRYTRVLPMEGKTTSYPVINETDRSKGPGLLTAGTVAEGAQATRQTIKMREMLLRAHKKFMYWSATSELLQEAAPGTDDAMFRSAGGALAMQIDREIWNGSGVGEMLGIRNAGATIEHAKDGGQTADTVTFTNLTGMVGRLLPSGWNAAIWVMHPSVLPALFGVYLATGASGGIPAPLTQGADGSYRLFGRPIVVSDFAAPLGDAGDISLVDLSQYVVGIREDLRFEVSREFLFDSDEVAYRVIQRRDGQPLLNAAVTPARGSTTLSPFVTLAERA